MLENAVVDIVALVSHIITMQRPEYFPVTNSRKKQIYDCEIQLFPEAFLATTKQAL